jgi:HAD superfamily hydrolase (TIGR01549 family)
MSANKPQVLIFDLGNVLVHYDHRATCAGVAVLCQVDANAVASLLHEVGDDMGVGRLDFDGFHRFMQARAGATADRNAFWLGFCAGLRRNDEALAYAVGLQQRAGVSVAVISNTNDGHVLWLDEHVPELREFDLVMMSNEVGLHKPDPEIFKLALELLAVEPRGALFIDDLAQNVAAAQTLGMAGIVHTDWADTRAKIAEWLSD